jgi:hypothetical protein
MAGTAAIWGSGPDAVRECPTQCPAVALVIAKTSISARPSVLSSRSSVPSALSGQRPHDRLAQSTYIYRMLLRKKQKLESLDVIFVGATVILFVEL